MVMDPAPIHGNMGQQIQHRLARGEWVRLGKAVGLHEDVPGAGVMLHEEGRPLLLELLVTMGGDDMHYAVTMGDGSLQLYET
jgi:hypothetical protein